MSAVLTLGTVAVDTTGKVMTATISGGTGTGYAITNATGLTPKITAGPTYSFPISSVSVSGTTLTINLTIPLAATDTIRLDIAAGSNLTDSGANTPTGQTNLVATNNSTVAVTKFDYTSNVFEIHGKCSTGTQSGDPFVRFPLLAFAPYEYEIEFVCDATEIALLALASNSSAQVDGGSDTATTYNNSGGFAAHAITTTPLASGKHLVRLIFGDYFLGVRLTGGARTMHLVPTTKRTIAAASGTYPGTMASGGSVITAYGAYQPNAVSGDAPVTTYLGITLDTKFTGSGVEIVTTASVSAAWGVSVDGGPEGALVPGGDSTVNGVNAHVPLAWGKTQGVQHTLHATFVGVGGNTTHSWLRVVNGSATTASSAISATTITVASVTNIAVNDWVRIDTMKNLECRQVTAISGTGPYTLTVAALAKAHASGVPVTSYLAPAGSLASWVQKDLSAKRIVAMGDSNTQGANDYGGTGTPDANGTYYGLYDPRTTGFYQACQAIGYELINLGIQGQTTAQIAARSADMSNFGRGACDHVLVWAGTNDINGSSSATPDQWKASVQTIVTAAVPLLRTGGRVIVIPCPTPVGVTNAGGLNYAAQLTKIAELVAANPGVVVDGTSIVSRIVGGDVNTPVHYHPSGQLKVGQDTVPVISGTRIFANTGTFAFPVQALTHLP